MKLNDDSEVMYSKAPLTEENKMLAVKKFDKADNKNMLNQEKKKIMQADFEFSDKIREFWNSAKSKLAVFVKKLPISFAGQESEKNNKFDLGR